MGLPKNIPEIEKTPSGADKKILRVNKKKEDVLRDHGVPFETVTEFRCAEKDHDCVREIEITLPADMIERDRIETILAIHKIKAEGGSGENTKKSKATIKPTQTPPQLD
jgi:hypothetical protein